MSQQTNRVAIVTGASRGIGAAIAKGWRTTASPSSSTIPATLLPPRNSPARSRKRAARR